MLRFGFVTCVRLGLSCMEAIYDAGGRLATVLTLRDDIAPAKSGRVHADEFCRAHAIPLVKIRNINDVDALAAITAADLDWLFIIGWSQIARSAVLQSVRRGVLGIHPTLLPIGRGRASIPWAILKGMSETGVTLFQLDGGVDTGPVLLQQRLPISDRETATSLYAKVIAAHREALRAVWPDLVAGRVVARPQDERAATIWPGRTPADGQLRPEMTSEQMDRLVRATTRPYPGAFWVDAGRTVRVWSGAIADVRDNPRPGALRIFSSDGAFDAWEYETEVSKATPAMAPTIQPTKR
jgi:methionyl-tRNA formyltransferase